MAKLGTHKRPAVVRVRSQEMASEIVAFCQERGWIVIAGVEPNKPEDTSDLDKLMRQRTVVEPAAPRMPPRISGNVYCPCGSEKKYKKCCGAVRPAG